MRFAVATTTLAAVVAVPLAGFALAPQMAPDQFVSAVRCVAYEDAVSPGADLGAAKWRLNAEAARQPAAAVQRAHQEAGLVTRQIALSSQPSEQLREACSSALA
jgi:hypothetical protein